MACIIFYKNQKKEWKGWKTHYQIRIINFVVKYWRRKVKEKNMLCIGKKIEAYG